MPTGKQKVCLWFALALMPDDREKSRSCLRRYVVMHGKQEGAVSKYQTKKLVRGMPRSQASMVGVGVAVYRIAYERPSLIFGLIAGSLFIAYEAISALLK